HVLGLDELRLSVRVAGLLVEDLDAIDVVVAADEAPEALQPRDLVLAEQELDALGHPAHDRRLARLHLRDVEAHAVDVDAVRAVALAHQLVSLAGSEQRLRRDAADVQAGSAERELAFVVAPALDAGDVHAELRGADRRDVAAGAGTDHDDVVDLGHARL